MDAGPNIIIRKPATPGMENRKTVVLQAHLDMVPQKNSDKEFDFEKDGIEAYIDGDWVTANGTTLGADNGIGASAILAVLEDRTVKHGPIEALFTATEETGMDGAFALRPGELKGDILINLDSETEGELYVGCAGGLDLTATMKYDTVSSTAKTSPDTDSKSRVSKAATPAWKLSSSEPTPTSSSPASCATARKSSASCSATSTAAACATPFRARHSPPWQ